MKKFFTLIVAALACMTANAESVTLTPCAPNAYWGSKCVGWGTVSFTSQWGEYKIATISDVSAYKSVKLDYKDNVDAQLTIKGGVSGDDLYTGLESEGSVTKDLTFASSTSCTIEAQGTAAGGQMTIVGVTLIKADGTEEVLTDGVGTSWGCSYATNNINFTNEGGEIGFKETLPAYEEGKQILYSVGFEAISGTMTWKICVPETSAAVTRGLAQLSDYDSKYYVYSDIPGTELKNCYRESTIGIDFDYTTVTIMSKADAVGQTVSNITASYEIEDATAINAVEAAPAAQKTYKTVKGIVKNGVKYNFAGQRVK